MYVIKKYRLLHAYLIVQYSTIQHIHWRISTQIQYVVQLPMEISVDHLHVQMKFVGVAKSPIK